MKKNRNLAIGHIGLGLCAVFLGSLTGCVGYVDGPRYRGEYVQPAPVYVEAPPEYVYYPGYEVYYSTRTRQYVYPEGRAWVARPAPPHISVEVLGAAPSVRLDFHDHPSTHHATVVQQYPKQWAPPGFNRNRQ